MVFDERLTFDFKNKEGEEINQGTVLIECFDANVLLSNVLIGAFQFDLSMVYYKKHHELYKPWVALTDVTGEHEGVQGYLQVTIQVLGPKDEMYIHPASEEMDLEGSMLNVMMPPAVETTPNLLKIYVQQLNKLMIMDKLAKSSDPFVEIEFSGNSHQTSIFKKKLDVFVHECVTLPVNEPVLGNNIFVRVMDWDLAGSNDVIGTFIFKYNKIKQKPMKNRWVHMYGSPQGAGGDVADKMNKAILPGTTYRGSMMIGMSVDREPGDEELKKDCYTVQFNSKKESPATTQWVLQVDVYQGVEVGDGAGKFKIEMQIRALVTSTDWGNCQRGACEWYDMMSLDTDDDGDTIELRMPKDPEECPDVIFYLIEKAGGFDVKNQVVSYLRFKWRDLLKMGFTTPPKWYTFKASPVLSDLSEEDFPGTILMGIRAGLREDMPKEVQPEARPFLTVDASDNKDPLEEIHNELNNGPASQLQKALLKVKEEEALLKNRNRTV